MIDFAELRNALSDRILTTSGVTSTMCAWLNPTSYKQQTNYLEFDLAPGPSKRITFGDTATFEQRAIVALKLFVPADVGYGTTVALLQAILARFDWTWSLALSGNTYAYIDGERLPTIGQVLPAIGNRFYAVAQINLLLRSRNAVAA